MDFRYQLRLVVELILKLYYVKGFMGSKTQA